MTHRPVRMCGPDNIERVQYTEYREQCQSVFIGFSKRFRFDIDVTGTSILLEENLFRGPGDEHRLDGKVKNDSPPSSR